MLIMIKVFYNAFYLLYLIAICFLNKINVLSQTRENNQVVINEGDGRSAQYAQDVSSAEMNLTEDYKKYLQFTVEQLKFNQHYTVDLYMKLMSAIGKRASLENYRKNLSAMNYIVAECSHKLFLRDFSPRFDKRRRDFFLQFYSLPNLFHTV